MGATQQHGLALHLPLVIQRRHKDDLRILSTAAGAALSTTNRISIRQDERIPLGDRSRIDDQPERGDMALFEIQVIRQSGEIEIRYSDQPLNVGDRITIDTRSVIILRQVATPTSPLATAAYLCTEPNNPTTHNQPLRKTRHQLAA